MWHKGLLFVLVSLLLSATESTITFSGFTEGTEYTYYTNEDNSITELTCIATSTDTSVTSISTSWYYKDSSNAITDTGSSVLRLVDVATVLNWRQKRAYFCRAVYDMNGGKQQEDSGNIVVAIEYNTTITVIYGDTVHIRSITNRDMVPIPVMTESVVISCDAEGGDWTYTGQNRVTNPVTIVLLTIENAIYYDCRKRDPTGSRRAVHSVNVQAVGSGIWLEKQDTYTELSEAETVVLTEDRTLVCVSSASSAYTAWYYRGNTNIGTGERIVDIESDQSRGFLRLNLPQSLPANRIGYYYCNSNENIDTGHTQFNDHSIIISLPADTTTTPVSTTEIVTATTTTSVPTTTTTQMQSTSSTTKKRIIGTTPPVTETTPTPTTPTTADSTPVPISLQLHYTPNYRVVFVGVDDVTLVCVASSDSGTMLNVSLLDIQTDNILKSQSGSEAEIQLEQRVELTKGDLLFKCSVATETGEREQQSVSIRAEDPYTQEILNLRTDTSSGEVLLEWDTSHALLANETFTVRIYSLNGTGVSPRTGTTRSREYPLRGLYLSHHYILWIQVLSRLGAHNSSLHYVHSDSGTAGSSYAAGGLVAGLFLVLVLTAVGVLVLVVVLLCRRRWNSKYSYTKQTQDSVPEETEHKFKEYIPLSDINSVDTPHTAASKNSPGYKYEPMESVSPANKDYYPLEMEPTGKYYEIPSDDLIPKRISPNKPEIPLASLKKHLDTLWENGMQGLGVEFDQLQLNLMRGTQEHGRREINSGLNIDRTTLPYDTSRVILQGGTEIDYINASLIPGRVTNRNFISTHFPTDGTEERFWRMVWEQRVSCVLLAATCEEVLGVRRHWPQSDSPRVMGPLTVKFVSAEEMGECVVCRRVGVSLCKNPSQVREVVLVEYSGWPVNEHSMLTLGLLESVRTAREVVRNKRDAPVCVACNTGCGRSGCVIALYNMLDSISDGRESVSVFNCVNEMRNHRPYIVQTLNQYKIINTALLEIVYGDTSVKLCDVTPGEERIRSEFKELEYQCVKAFQRPCLIAKQHDASGLPLPYDDTRVAIESPATSHLSYAYYNASYISSVGSQSNQFISAVSPTEDTVCQFLETVFQHKCSLVIAVGKWNANKYARYWEIKDEMFDCLQLSCLSTSRKESLVFSELKLKRTSTNKSHKFTHILYDTCSEEVSSGRHESLLALLDTLLASERQPVLVHCGDGVGMSGVLLAAYYAVKMRTEDRVDILQACKLLRKHRQDMLPTHEQYQVCYGAVRQYLDTRLAQTYENLSSAS